MPGFDRTGPLGAGPRTGRGLGYCSGFYPSNIPYPSFGFRGGFGFGRRGGGRGWRNWFYAAGAPGWAALTPEQESADLKAQADWLRGQLDDIQKRLDELEAK